MNPLLLETIRLTDGNPHLLELHIGRMQRSCRELFGCDAPSLRLNAGDVPSEFRNGTVKCRITYSRTILNIEFGHYAPRRVRSLRMVNADDIDYHLKYADRDRLQDLRSRKGDADEVLIVRDGLVTDTSYSNIICLSDAGWLTPARPLLEGVMRRHLLETGIIEEADITPDMLRPGNGYGISGVIMINAMLPPGSVAPIPVCHIGI